MGLHFETILNPRGDKWIHSLPQRLRNPLEKKCPPSHLETISQTKHQRERKCPLYPPIHFLIMHSSRLPNERKCPPSLQTITFPQIQHPQRKNASRIFGHIFSRRKA